MRIRIGAHVDMDDPLGHARERNAEIIQVSLGDPQSWKAPSISYPTGVQGLREDVEAAGLDLYVHSPFVLNLASTNNRIRIPSRKLLQQTVNLAAQIGAKGVVVHGGHVTAGDDLVAGFDNWRKAIDGLEARCPVLIENTAGGSKAMARHLENIDRLWDALSRSAGGEQVGFCLDTCHAHAAGEELIGLVDRVMAITGRIDLVHCNDSRDAFGSGADRHANLGQGQCDPLGMVAVVAQADAPTIVETPGGKEFQRCDIEWLRSHL